MCDKNLLWAFRNDEARKAGTIFSKGTNTRKRLDYENEAVTLPKLELDFQL